MPEKKAHIYYFDRLRVISALGVVFMHAAASGLRAGVLEGPPYVTRGWHLMNLFTSFAFSAVPLFFMISGYLLFSDEKTARTDLLFRRRLPRLAVPLAAWTVLTALWMALAEGFQASAFLSRLRDALYGPVITPLWFLYSLIVFYLLSPFLYAGLRGLAPGGHKLVLAIIGAVSLRAMLRAMLPAEWGHWLDFAFLNPLQALGGNLLLMLLGWYLGSWKKKVSNALLAALALGTFFVIVLGTYLRTRIYGYYDQSFQSQSAGFEVLFAACLFLLAKQNLDRPSRLLDALGLVPLCFPIYLSHGLALLVCGRYGLDPLRFPEILALAAGVFAACYLVSKTMASVPGLCWIFTGLRFAEARKSCSWQSLRRGGEISSEGKSPGGK